MDNFVISTLDAIPGYDGEMQYCGFVESRESRFLKPEAEKLGANAVIGVKVTAASSGPYDVRVVYTGTAVHIELTKLNRFSKS